MINMSSWGNIEKSFSELNYISSRNSLEDILSLKTSFLPRGNGRSYGDVCTNSGYALLSSFFLDNIINFSPENETITCESGILLRDLQKFLVKKGYMLPVTPGTQLITVGGAIANDVHCKNHHLYGTFGNNLLSFKLVRSDGEILFCSRDVNQGLFRATIGGIGLTGFITEATIKIRKINNIWINAENIAYSNLDEFYELACKSEENYEHTVSWIDCITGNGQRGIFMRGNNSKEEEDYREIKYHNLSVPFLMPFSLVNQFSLYGFNKLYYFVQSLKKCFKVHYEKFFYPLDNINQWNYIYGPKGFYQYQFVVPLSGGLDAVREVQREIAKAREGSFLGVLKTFGDIKPEGLLSFPYKGITYALDFPNKGVSTIKLLNRLDDIIKNAHGRLYLAKDARQPRVLFENGYKDNIEEFLKYKDPKISSDLSRRLLGV
ncbi:MAG: FAD-binding oxidoreductase [Methanosphaera sp.]|nr:FAD-binding oxidoreductase [Methanosphaera sp.]